MPPQQAVAVTVPRPRSPADAAGPGPKELGTGPALLTARIADDGRRHPSNAVRRVNLAIEPGQDPFIRHYFPAVAAFRRGTALARRPVLASDEHQDAGDVFAAGVGRKVKAAREAAGLAQSTLERNAGLRPCTVSQLERGESDVPVFDLFRIAEAVGVDVADLLPGDPGDEPAGPAAAPTNRRMAVVHVCWHCYGGADEKCCYSGWIDPRRSPGLFVDCHCARIRHPASMADGGRSTRLYDASGAEVFPRPAPAQRRSGVRPAPPTSRPGRRRRPRRT